MGSKRTYWPRGQRAFTLVEVLIVIAIIGILSAIAVSMFTKYKMRSYKTVLDHDAKNVYISAQAYLTDNIGATVDTLSELNSGGYVTSPNIFFVNGNITTHSGNVEIYSDALNTQGKDNNSVIFANGRIVFANAPM